MIVVTRNDREELIKIRAGEYSYFGTARESRKEVKRIEQLYCASDLTVAPDYEYAARLLVNIRTDFYSGKVL